MMIGTTLATWLTLLATAQAEPGETVYINKRDFPIPITHSDPKKKEEIKQLFLYVSTDEGKTWRQEAVASPDQKSFPFFATGDGAYWFNVSVVDKQDKTDPPDIAAVKPLLKVVIDSRKPLVKLHSPERQADQASVSWEIHDENPDPATFKLEYKTAESPSWYTVPMSETPTATGQKRWSVSTPGAVSVRLQVQDAAGNASVAELSLPGNAESSPTVTTVFSPPPQPPAAQASRLAPGSLVADKGFPTHNWSPPSQGADAPRSPVQQTPDAFAPTPAAPPVETGPKPIATSDNAPYRSGGSSTYANPAVNSGYEGPAGTPRYGAPGLVFTNNAHVDLNYQITRIGPSNVGAVELWLTEDEGRTWRRFAEDADLEPPFAVDLPREGVYGLSLVVRSRAGLGKQSPLPGETPELRLELDTTPPTAALFAPKADPRRRDVLLLQWSASDRNLTATPINLQWAEQPGGPWQTIANNLPNNERHNWQMPEKLPYRVYLRLEVHDQAGNIGVAETPAPVLVDLTEPEGKLIGVMAPARK